MAKGQRLKLAETSATPPNVGSVIQQLRRQRGLTLEQLAARSSVSRSMLSKIERSQTNPTLGTVWKLAVALGIGIEEVVGHHQCEQNIRHVKAFETPTLGSADGGCTLRILSPVEMAGLVEWYELVATPRAALVSEAHQAGTVEHLTVVSGRMVVESAGRSCELGSGDTARYAADVRHAIRNPHSKPARALMIVLYRHPQAIAGDIR